MHDTTDALHLLAVHAGPVHAGTRIDTVAGTTPDGSGYVRTYRCNMPPISGQAPTPLATVKHGNAYAYVRSIGGIDADGIG